MCSAVDALALDEWRVIDVVLRLGEGRKRRRRANNEHLCLAPVLNGGRIVGESTASGATHRSSLETSTDDNRRDSVE